MSRKDRMNARTKREHKKPFKNPEIKYYLIVTDTKATERCFFEGLYRNLPQNMQDKICLRVYDDVETAKMVEKCKSFVAYDAQYRIPWIVFDRDQVSNFDGIIAEAERCGICAGWSNPCFEIWLLAYFGSMPTYTESQQCCTAFSCAYKKATGQIYTKSDNRLYEKIYASGNEEKALKIAKQRLEQHRRDMKEKPSEMCPATTVHELVGAIRGNQ